MENGTMMLGELEHILLSLGEKLEREEVDILIKECCDPEDDDGFIPYERKLLILNIHWFALIISW